MSSDRVAFVTGGASGLGRAIADRLAVDRVTVIVADIDSEGAQAAAKKITVTGGEAMGVECDVSSPASVEAASDRALEQYRALQRDGLRTHHQHRVGRGPCRVDG